MSSIATEATRPAASIESKTSAGSARRDELLRDVHWTRPDGGVCFATTDESPGEADRRWERLSEAVREFGDADLQKIARAARNREGKPAATTKGSPKPAPSYHSEALRSTVLRTDWSKKAVQLAIDWSRPVVQAELAVGGNLVVAGAMPAHVVVNGHARPIVGSWEEVCFDADAEADYLELEVSLGGGFHLQRQFVLLRRDGLLWIADAVLAPTLADLQCELTLPFVPRAKFTPAEDTQEIEAAVGRSRLAILPPALAEWRVDHRGGEVAVVDGAVRLQRSVHQVAAVYAPLCLIVDSRRAKSECTWRRLTIGADRQIQSADKAVGYRVQLGREQWLFYRSLTPRANRTVLGVNLQSDFLAARFNRDGTTETLMEIEE